MEIISFEKRTFEEIAAKLDRFVQRVESLCREHGGKETSEWMDNPDFPEIRKDKYKRISC